MAKVKREPIEEATFLHFINEYMQDMSIFEKHKPAEITLDTKFADDLELVMSIEEEYSVSIGDEVWQDVRDVRHALKAVNERIA